MLYEVKKTIIERLDLLKDQWIWAYISYNDRITWDIISETLDKFPWVWSNVSYNKNITWDIIKNNLHLPWNWETLTLSRKITWDIIRDNPHIPWTKGLIPYNPNITLEIVQNNCDSDIPWDTQGLSLNRDTYHHSEWEYIVSGLKEPMHHNNSVSIKEWNWYRISTHPQLTWKFIESNPFYNWDWEYISAREFITIEILMNNLTKFPWHWNKILMNANMTWEIIQTHFLNADRDPSIPELNWACISQNPNITWSIVNKFPDYPWNYYFLLKNNSIIEEILESHEVRKYPLFDDIYERFYVEIPNSSEHNSNANNITENIEWDSINRMELVFPIRKWTASLTFEKIRDIYANNYHIFKHKHLVSENPNVLLTAQEEETFVRRHLCAFKLIRAWRDSISNPNFQVCRRRLTSEFQHLQKSSS